MTGPGGTVERASRRPAKPLLLAIVAVVVVGLSLLALEWDFSWLFESEARGKSFSRFFAFIGGMLDPDLSPEYIGRTLAWARETVTTALLGTVAGALLGWFIALSASEAVSRKLGGSGNGRGLWARLRAGATLVRVEASRLLLDVLRGVPDFVWGVMMVPVFGFNRVIGTIAIGLSVAGILGKIYSELWDNVDPRRLEPLRGLGAGRMVTHFYGTQPLTARAMVSFTLMRAECAIRNSTVLGVIVGGGLGGALMDEISNDRFDRVGTVVLATLAVTILADLASNAIRRQIRNDPNHPRTGNTTPRTQMLMTWLGVGMAAAVALWGLLDHVWPYVGERSAVYVAGAPPAVPRSDISRAIAELDTAAFDYWWESIKDGFFHPDLSLGTVSDALSSSLIPVAVAVLATGMSILMAAWLAWAGSVTFQLEPGRFTGERIRDRTTRMGVVAGRTAVFSIGKGIALVFRAVPEVLWCLILMRLFSFGPLAAIAAIALHSAGVLARVYSESVDNVPLRKLEVACTGNRLKSFGTVGIPHVWREWMTYGFFQFESNVRIGVVLGMVGLGGLGFEFQYAYGQFHESRASTLLLTMILLTTVIDRTSRALKISRAPK